MKTAIYADTLRRAQLEPILAERRATGHIRDCVFYDSYDELLATLAESGSDIIIIAQEGAGGMESARAVKILLPGAHLIWLTNDRGFGPESYRIGCSYFSASPITEQLIKTALSRCAKKGV